MTEERNNLKGQVNRMKVKCNVSSKDIRKRRVIKGKRITIVTTQRIRIQRRNKHVASVEKTIRENVCWIRMCYNCDQEGHLSPNCPKPKKRGCFACGRTGHRVKTCPKKKTGGGSGRKKD